MGSAQGICTGDLHRGSAQGHHRGHLHMGTAHGLCTQALHRGSAHGHHTGPAVSASAALTQTADQQPKVISNEHCTNTITIIL